METRGHLQTATTTIKRINAEKDYMLEGKETEENLHQETLEKLTSRE